MSLKIVIDMNLPPGWAALLTGLGWPATHWTSIGDPKAVDAEIMAWAVANDHVVFTHDLDFGTLLALTKANGPSVIQLRTDEVFPHLIGAPVLAVLRAHEAELKAGAIVTIDRNGSRVRVLPF